MAVQVSKSGGIYIEIDGNVQPLAQALGNAKLIGSQAAGDIADAFKYALSGIDANRITSNVTKSFAQAKAAAQGFKADISTFENSFKQMGREIGLSGKQLEVFAKAQSKALHKKNAEDFQQALRAVQRQAGLTNEQMQELAQSMGGAFETGSRQAKSAGASIASLGVKVGALAAAYVSLRAVSGAVSGFAGLGIDYNQQLENAQLGISTVLALNNKIVDSQGRMLQGAEKFAAAQQISVDIVKALDAATVSSMVDFSDLLKAFQSSLGLAQSKGIGWQDTIDMVTLMGNTMKAANIDIQTLDKEMRRFLTGKDLGNSQVLKILSGLDEKTVKSWDTAAKFIDGFTQALKESKYAGEAAQRTYEVSTAAVKENMQSLAAEMTKPLFDDLSKAAYDFADAIFHIDAATKTWTVNENMQPLVDIGKEIADLMGDAVLLGVEGVTGALEGLGRFIGNEGKEIAAFFRGIGDIVSSIADGAIDATKKLANMVSEVGKLPGYTRLDDSRGVTREAPTLAALSSSGSAILNQYDQFNAGPRLTRLGDSSGIVRAEVSSVSQAVSGMVDSFKQGIDDIKVYADDGAKTVGESAKKAADDLKLIAKPVTPDFDSKGGSSALKSAESALESLRSKVLSLQAQLDQNKGQGFLVGLNKELAGLEKRMGKASEATILEFQTLKEQAQAIGKQIVSEQNLDTQNKFWSEFHSLTGQGLAQTTEAHERALEKQAELYRNAGVEIVDIEAWVTAKRLEYATDFESGIKRAFNNYARNASDAAKSAESFVTNSFQGMEDAIVQFVKTGKLDFSSMVDSMISDLTRLTLRMAMFGSNGSGGLFGSLVSGIGGLFGGGGSFGGAYSSGVVQTVPRAAMYGPSALGNVFSGGNISAYSGSIVTRPTLFSAGSQLKEYALGGGLMGEAGAEAIIPLRRGSGGRLGVDASGLGAQQQAPQVNVIVNTPPGVAVTEKQQTQNSQGGLDMTILLEMVDKAMASGISSGRSKTAHAMNMRGI